MDFAGRVTTGLSGAGWTVIDWARTALLDTLTIGGKPVIMVRFAGYTPTDGGLREVVAVTLVLGLADDPTLRSGQTVQATTADLINALNSVPSCFPELAPVRVEYDWDPIPNGPPLVAVHVDCTGDWT